jgi:hypothetical protein
LVFSGPSAFGAFNHNVVETKFKLGPPCVQARDIAVLEKEKIVYVSCWNGEFLYWGGSTTAVDIVKKFDYDGNPLAFTAVAPYLEDNEIQQDPANIPNVFFNNAELAVDNSESDNHGRLFVTSAQDLDVFEPTGKFLLSVFQPDEDISPNELEGVDVDEDGFFYVTTQHPFSPIKKYNTAFNEVERLYKDPEGRHFHHFRIDSTGAVWAGWETDSNPVFRQLDKYEADQFTTELTPTPYEIPATGLERFYAKTSPFSKSPLLFGPQESIRRFDVDLTDDDLYVNRNNRIETYSAGNATEFSYENAPAFGVGTLNESVAVAVTKDHKVFASTQGGEGPEVVRFGPGEILPDVHTEVPGLDDIGHNDVDVQGEVELAGGSSVTACVIEYGTPPNYPLSEPCSPSSFSEDEEVTATLSGLTTGTTYHYRIKATTSKGSNYGIERLVTPAHVLQVQTLPATEIDQNGATLNASFDPDGIATTYRFEYGPTTAYDFKTPELSGGSGTGVVSFGASVDSLPSGRTFHYRVIAKNAGGTTIGPDRTFRTASSPDIEGVRASHIEPTSAHLHATINPLGYPTKYYFEYGPTPEYGQTEPIEPASIGSGTEPIEVIEILEGLQPGLTYHYRVVAESEPWGATVGDDTTFDYAPPGCPNDHVRQLTLGSYLPDCRAYELVSPEEAGSILLHPSAAVLQTGEFTGPIPYHEGQKYNINTGFASSPSRFAFYGGLGTIKGLDGPANGADMYVATRTDNGWDTTLPALKGSEAAFTGRKECSESLDVCIDHQENDLWGFDPEWSPYMFDISGERLGRLPTNVHTIPGGIDFRGAQRLSGNGNHFVFSSNELQDEGLFPALAFAPGGVTAPFGSAYDNNIGARTVTIISKLPNGQDIPETAPKAKTEKSFDFPGLSPDASHILMSTPAGGSLLHLFMRVNQTITYDITKGAGVEFVGMTRDGSEVMFATTAQLTGDDTDTSKDLFVWNEDGPNPDSVTRISKGNGKGNTDACNPSWATKCDAVPLAPEWWHPNKNKALSAPGKDDIIAETNGDVYFYSPEVLDPTRLGLINERNLYVYRDGKVQLVGALDVGNPVKRMQIAPDGEHAAILTASRLTQYDNKEFDQVYTYNADTRVTRCASCFPTGVPPTEDAYASQGGRFMANDGRTFFATADDLVPRDADGGKIDVYEYVDGRPQLITTGLAARDFTGGGGQSIVSLPVSDIGLEYVSRNGVDVIFSTYESILPDDRNGQFIKFYNARTGGGFPRDPNLGPCVAADECHGVDSARPPARAINSETDLGASGNVTQEAVPRACGKSKVRRGGRCVNRARSKKRRNARTRKARAAHDNGRGK